MVQLAPVRYGAMIEEALAFEGAEHGVGKEGGGAHGGSGQRAAQAHACVPARAHCAALVHLNPFSNSHVLRRALRCCTENELTLFQRLPCLVYTSDIAQLPSGTDFSVPGTYCAHDYAVQAP